MDAGVLLTMWSVSEYVLCIYNVRFHGFLWGVYQEPACRAPPDTPRQLCLSAPLEFDISPPPINAAIINKSCWKGPWEVKCIARVDSYRMALSNPPIGRVEIKILKTEGDRSSIQPCEDQFSYTLFLRLTGKRLADVLILRFLPHWVKLAARSLFARHR
ncbi:hypothetical protein BJX70DRAFT_44391 [Aspergillus crustosus]